MRLTDAALPTRDLDAVAHVYGDLLGLATTRRDDRVVIVAGATRLTFVLDPDLAGAQHLAFTIPTGTLASAKTVLAVRATVIRNPEGFDEFEGPPSWNSRSVYFEGPDSQILEVIERRSLRGSRAGRGPLRIQCVSEVGVAVPDVPAAVARLRDAGIPPYGGPPGPDFAPVGDADGLLILVAPGRPWAPAFDRAPAESAVLVSCDPEAEVDLADGRSLRSADGFSPDALSRRE